MKATFTKRKAQIDRYEGQVMKKSCQSKEKRVWKSKNQNSEMEVQNQKD